MDATQPPEESDFATAPEGTKFVVRFSFANDATRSNTSAAGDYADGRCYWADTRQVAVQNTTADTVMKIALMKQTEIGQDDVLVSEGQVPVEKLASIYEQVDVKQKSFNLEMMKGGAPGGTMKVKIMFTKELLNQGEEEKKEEEMVPAGNLAAQ